MVSSLLLAAIVSVAQAAPAQTILVSRTARVESTVDSIRALRSARRAQASFETIRRMNLPREAGVGSHHCDVRVGRWCVWNDESNDREPPPEAPQIRRARERLLAMLDTLGDEHPADRWIASQRVRYLLEAGRHAEAVNVAERCAASGTHHLCAMLAGLAYHDSGAVSAADSAFSAGLAAMPDSVRCRWTDISLLLEGDVADRYRHADCAERERMATSFWHLTTPLYLRDHDWRNEFLARVARAEMEKDSRTTSGSPDEPAFRETALRYGFDTWFVRDDPPLGSMADAAIGGYRAGGTGYNFVPNPSVFESPAGLRIGDWDLKLRSAQTNYAPRYARHFRTLDRKQVAIFRRGDSALVVASYDASDDTLFTRDSLEAGLYAASVDSTAIGEPHGTTTLGAAPAGVLTTGAPWSPMIVSVELLNSKTRSAARVRFGIRPLPNEGRVQLSDLLLFAPHSADSLPRQLDDALPEALRSDRITSTGPLGVFWETYGVRPTGESFAVTITIDRIREGLMRRAAERMHLASPFSPVKVEWSEVPNGANGISSRAVKLDLSQLGNGRYEISVTIAPADGAPVTAKRDIVLDR
jgi:hypothetical protein